MKYLRTTFPASLLVASLALLISACTPQSRLALDPVASRTRWLMGKNFAVIADSFAVVAVAFDRDAGQQLHFDLEVTNLSGDTVLISPEKLTYDITHDSTLRIWKDTSVAALDPEPMLRRLVASREYEQGDYSSHLQGRNIDAIVGGVVTVVRAVTDGDKKSSEEKVKEDSAEAARRAEQLAGYLKRDQEHHEKMSYLNDLERNWGVALRKTSLAEREMIRGRVIFNPVRDAKGIRLSVPVGSRIYKFIFRQKPEK